MMIFLPVNDGATEITVKASGINGSNAMTKTGLTVGKNGITTVSMCVGRVTLSAKESKVNATDVTISVESDVYKRQDERSGGHQPGSDYVSWDGSVYGGRHRAGVGRACERGFRLYLWKK